MSRNKRCLDREKHGNVQHADIAHNLQSLNYWYTWLLVLLPSWIKSQALNAALDVKGILGGHFQEEMEGSCVCFFVHKSINGGKRMGQLRAKDWFIFVDNEPNTKPFQQPIWLLCAAFTRSPSPVICFLTAWSSRTYLGPLDLLGPFFSCIHPAGLLSLTHQGHK